MTELVLRNAVAGDVAFIKSNWFRTWRRSPWAGVIPNDKFHEVTEDAIEQIIRRGARLRVACIGERLVAFLCSELTRDGRAVAHAGFAKDPYLALRPLERLVDEMPGTRPVLVTFRTPQLIHALGTDWVHAPEVARRRHA
jgi:hypothetical protein